MKGITKRNITINQILLAMEKKYISSPQFFVFYTSSNMY